MSNWYFCIVVAHQEIAEARSAAARDRLALTAAQTGREAQRCERAPLAKVLSMLTGAFGLRRPALLRQ